MGTLRTALVAGFPALALTACAVETGKVAVTVSCEDASCADTGGDVIASVEDCDEDSGTYGEQAVHVASWQTAATVGFVFENVLEGERCVQAFLDADASGHVTVGDVVSSAAIAGGVDEESDDEDDDLDDDPEVEVDVNEDETSVLGITLDTVVAPGSFLDESGDDDETEDPFDTDGDPDDGFDG